MIASIIPNAPAHNRNIRLRLRRRAEVQWALYPNIIASAEDRAQCVFRQADCGKVRTILRTHRDDPPADQLHPLARLKHARLGHLVVLLAGPQAGAWRSSTHDSLLIKNRIQPSTSLYAPASKPTNSFLPLRKVGARKLPEGPSSTASRSARLGLSLAR